jgi:hypothetical protein
MTDRNESISNGTVNMAISNAVMPPLKVIRAYCLDCCCGDTREVQRCPATDCPIHIYRLGRKLGKGISTIKSIRLRCINCSGYSIKDVEDCWNTGCPLYPYRMGRNPNRTGIGGNGIALRMWRENQETQVSTGDLEVEEDAPLELVTADESNG